MWQPSLRKLRPFLANFVRSKRHFLHTSSHTKGEASSGKHGFHRNLKLKGQSVVISPVVSFSPGNSKRLLPVSAKPHLISDSTAKNINYVLIKRRLSRNNGHRSFLSHDIYKNTITSVRRYSDSNAHGITSRVYNFIYNETKLISESLSIKREPQVEILKESSISDSIRSELMAQVDDYNRFAVLLSHHPLAVPYTLLLRYYSNLPYVLTSEKKTLLEFLIFHNAWEEFWAIVLRENVTLTDLEEVVDQIFLCLSTNRNTEIGVWLALDAAQKESSGQNVYASICEMFKYKFGTPSTKIEIFSKISLITDQQFASDPLKLLLKNNELFLAENRDLKAFSIIKFAHNFANKGSISQFIIEQCQHDPLLHKLPGFVSMLCSKEVDLQQVRYFATRGATLRNELDLYYLLKSAPTEAINQLFLSFCHSYKKGAISSDYVINYFVMQTHLVREEVFLAITSKHYKALTIETLSSVILSLLENARGRQMLKTMGRRQHDKFCSLVKHVVKENKPSHVLLALLELSSNRGRHSQRIILRVLDPCRDYVEKIMSYDFTEYNLTELWRYAVRNNLLDSSNTGVLFQKTVQRSWKVKKRSSASRDAEFNGPKIGFREQFRIATRHEKHRLKVRLQAMAQALSQAKASQIASTLNNLQIYLFESKDQIMLCDNYGKSYVFDHLMRYTMKFIYRSNQGDGILKMRKVLKELKFDSIIVQASIFEYMTMAKPKVSLDVLENYKNKASSLTKPIISGIELGILTSPILKKMERLSLLQEFLEKKKQMGFDPGLHPRTIAFMRNLAFDILNRDGSKEDFGK